MKILCWAALLSLAAACSDKEEEGEDTDTGVEVTPFERDLQGQIYVQNEIGGASYHFDAEDDVYILYTSLPSKYELDDGSSFPDQKFFIETRYDPETRTFEGTIDWSDPEGTTAYGAERWAYTMIFSEDFTTIEGGEALWFDPDGVAFYSLRFGINLIYSRYEE